MKKISRFASVLTLAVSFSAPLIVFAQSGIQTGYLETYKNDIIDVINGILIPAIMSVAFLVFMWGVYKYFFWKGDSDTERATGRTFILYGVIGFVIISCIWGIVEIFSGTLGLDTGNAPKPPTFNTGGNSGLVPSNNPSVVL